jgi:MFS superfamily sulfate permease-like transporter
MANRLTNSTDRSQRGALSAFTDAALCGLVVCQLLDLHSSLGGSARELNHFILVAARFTTGVAGLVIAKSLGILAAIGLFVVHRRFPSLRVEVALYAFVALIAYVIVVINNYGWF